MTPNVIQKQLSRIEDEKLLNVDTLGTVRKRMVFAEHQSVFDNDDDEDEGNSIDSGLDHYKDACDVSHNTSLSSLSVDVGIRKTPGRVQTRKIDGHMSPTMENEILSNGKNERVGWLSPILSEEKQQLLEVDDDDENDVCHNDPVTELNSECMQPPLRTRLNFNAFTPNSNADGLDRKRQSFDEYDHNDDATPARKVERKNLNGPHLFNPNRKDSFPPVISGPRFAPFQLGVGDKLSPNEEYFRKELDKKQYSPIASAPEDIELSDSISGIVDTDSCVPKAKYGGNTPNDSIGTCGNSTQSAQSSTTNKTKKLRPLPDISAFDNGSNVTGSMMYNADSGDHGNESGISAQQFCPPTPLRTPAWAHRNGLHRSNSLVSSKVLAAMPPQVIDGFSSLEDSLIEDEKNKSVTFPCSSHSIEESFSPLLEERHFNDGSPKLDVKSALSLPMLRKVRAPTESRRTPASTFKAITMGPSINDETATISFLDDFDNVTKLGSGTFADVYKARSKEDGHFYAVKRNKRQFRGRKDRERALVEIHIMQRLQTISLSEWRDGNVSSKSSYCLYLLFFIRAWQENGHLFSQTELCCIHTCRHLMMNLTTYWNTASQIYPSLDLSPKAGGHLVPENTIWKICHDVSCGMSHIHSHNIVHHDIKPLNIFFVLHPKLGALCKLGDFGMAGETGTVDDGQEGDPAYMPQELLDCDKKDPSGDVFSLGITLYELATPGYWIAPVDGSKWHEIRSEDHVPEIPNSRSPELINLIKRMISPFKDKRPTADDILNDNAFINKAAIQEDKFLASYINDVDKVEKEKETENLKALARENNRQTPTPLQNRSTMRTPTPGSGPFS
jgi:serine/threonine protein kinase